MFDNLIEESEKKFLIIFHLNVIRVDVDYKSCISQMELHNCS